MHFVKEQSVTSMYTSMELGEAQALFPWSHPACDTGSVHDCLFTNRSSKHNEQPQHTVFLLKEDVSKQPFLITTLRLLWALKTKTQTQCNSEAVNPWFIFS